VLDLEPEPGMANGRVKSQGYAGDVASSPTAPPRLHLAEKDLGVTFRTGQAINPVERGHIAFRTDDIEAVKNRLKDKGHSLLRLRQPGP
jgi:4-hydroxyphenylpyruvate dioxygenase-like putative hemolysin